MATAAKPKRNSTRHFPKFLVDAQGRRTAVVLPPRAYKRLLEAAEDLEDIRAAEEARAEGGEPIPLEVVEADLRARGKLR